MKHTPFSDTGNMLSLIEQFPDHFQEGWQNAADFRTDIQLSDLQNVVVAGMGGSAIGGDLLRTYAADESRIPIQVVRGYTLPNYVDENSLVIVSSYSGNTEETLECFAQALDRSARIVCVASGGAVVRIAGQKHLSCIQFPGGMPPRAALGYSFAALLRISDAVGFCPVHERDLEETDILLREKGRVLWDERAGPAHDIAHQLKDRLPVIYSAAGLLEAVNLRWRGQFQENAKTLAYGNLYPELNHNEVMGWEGTPWLTDKMAVVTLRDRDDHPRVRMRMDILRELVSDSAAAWIEVESMGSSRLTRMLSLIQLGDWVSFHLARLNSVDPTPIRLIDQFKTRLTA